jgi:UDP-glucose 4-epimerase
LFVENLCAALCQAAVHSRAVGETFLVSDGESVAIGDLVRLIAAAMGRPARVWPVPVPLLQGGAAAVGRRDALQKLTASLVIDDRKVREMLDWAPPHTLRHGIQVTVEWYRHQVAAGKSRSPHP